MALQASFSLFRQASAAASIHMLLPKLHFIIVYDGALQRWMQMPFNTVNIDIPNI